MGKIMMNGIQYGVGGITDADDVKYTDLQTVKGALDEVKTGLSNRFDSGISTGHSISAGGSITVTVNFNHTFTTIPEVVTNLTRSYGTADVLAALAVNVTAVTASYFNVIIYNAGSLDVGAVGFRWIAVSA